jgi:hypothetical protein
MIFVELAATLNLTDFITGFCVAVLPAQGRRVEA